MRCSKTSMKFTKKIEKFEKMVSKVDDFIQGATSFLYDHIDDPSTQEIIECTRAIVCSNQEYLDKREASIEKLTNREKNIMELRFGFTSGIEKTQKEVADILGKEETLRREEKMNFNMKLNKEQKKLFLMLKQKQTDCLVNLIY